MFVWHKLDMKSALRRLYVLAIPFAATLLIGLSFIVYQFFLSFSFSFFTGYGWFFEYTSLGLKYFEELVFPVISNTTIFIALLVIISLAPLVVIGTWINNFISPFKDVKGFKNYGKVCEAIKSIIYQGPKKGKQIVATITLTIALTCLFISLWVLGQLGILTVNLNLSSLLLCLGVINLLLTIYFGSRIQNLLKKNVKTVQT